MRLQSVVFGKDDPDAGQLYYRADGKVRTADTGLKISAGASISTDTYMNAFDYTVWEKYSDNGLSVIFCIRLQGKGTLLLCSLKDGIESICERFDYQAEQAETFMFPVGGSRSGILYFKVYASEDTIISEAGYNTGQVPGSNNISLGLVICTYHRKTYITSHMNRFRQSKFFDPESGLYGKLQICIVDNASELQVCDGNNISIVHNPNTGGSGGFIRGIREFRKAEAKKSPTHVILMDDDVIFDMESFYRLFSFLSILAEKYEKEAVAGRMFRLDNHVIQYTAAEVWNSGDLKHIGFNLDMTEKKLLETMNDSAGAEYGGWWLCCFPMAYVKNEEPLPFFLHCDDAEYGLRHGGEPIILNGIQVWHETYEYRQTPIMTYYDTRNSMIVNAIIQSKKDQDKAFEDWFAQITRHHVSEDYEREYLSIRAMLDYLRGPGFVFDGREEERHRKLTGKKRFLHLANRFMWRFTAFYFQLNYQKITEEYAKLGERK